MAKIELEHWEKKASGWVFLSHSSKNYEDVKIVRNYLEENGFSALMFYLKCLEEDENKYLIKDLIKGEIESRNMFVLCDSEFSQASDWVEWELNEVEKLKNKIVKKVDMNTLKYKKATALSVLDDLINYATLYFIYHFQDRENVESIYTALNNKGYKILKNNPNETSRKKEFRMAVEEVSEDGTILIFLSKGGLVSDWFWNQKDKAIETKNKDFIIPIILDDVDINEFPAFRESQYIVNCNNLEFNFMIDVICEKIDMVRIEKERLKI